MCNFLNLLTSKQLILYQYCKEKMVVDKFAGAGRVMLHTQTFTKTDF